MIRLALIAWLALCSVAQAQLSGGVGGFPGPGTVHSSTAYAGPGDVVGSARMWWGLRAYSLAAAGSAAARVCNSGDANCADVNTLGNGDFDVATATGAPLSCGGAGGTCTIHTLYDQTAGNNCTAAHCNLVNATAAQRPTLVFNCIGTKPCMLFNGSSQRLQSSNSATSQAQPYTYSGVANSTNNSGNQSLVTFNSGGVTQLAFSNANNQAKIFAGSNLTAVAAGGSFHALQGVFNGASSDMNVDGASATGNAGAAASVGTINLSSVGGSSQYMNGSVAEAGAWPSAFNGTQSTNMSSNQHSYWGF